MIPPASLAGGSRKRIKMKDTRKHDKKVIEKGLKASDPTERSMAQGAAEKIRREERDTWTRQAREALVEETRKGNIDNATDIRDRMVRHRGGKMGRENRGEILEVGIHWKPGQYERIYGHN